MKQYNFAYLIFLSVVAALGGFLFGYDTAVISGTTNMVASQFGLDDISLGWYVGCALVGSIAGVLSAGVMGDFLGRKRSMIIAALLFTVSAVGCAVCGTFNELVIYRIVGGVGIGIASIICPLYISELAVAKYRGSLVSCYQLAITIGFLGAYLVNYGLLGYSETATTGDSLFDKVFVSEVWRGMLGMETLPAALFFVVIFIIPESPRWQILRGDLGAARATLGRVYLVSSEAEEQVEATRKVSENKDGGSEISMLFSPGIFKALLIGVGIAILGQFMGVNAVLYYGPKIFEDAGLSGGDSLFYQVMIGLVNTITTILALVIIDKVGRKQLIYWGVGGMIISLLLIAFYFTYGTEMGISSIFLLTFFLLYIFCCAISICAVVWVILSEMYPVKVRGIAMSIAGLALWIGTYLIGQLTPWLLKNATPAGTFIIFAAMCVPYILIMWKLVPETTGKSLEEIEQYWTRNQK